VGFPYPKDIEGWPIDAEKFNRDIGEVFDLLKWHLLPISLTIYIRHKYIGKEFSFQGAQTQYILNKIK